MKGTLDSFSYQVERLASHVLSSTREDWLSLIKDQARDADPVPDDHLYKIAYTVLYGQDEYKRHYEGELYHWRHYYEEDANFREKLESYNKEELDGLF